MLHEWKNWAKKAFHVNSLQRVQAQEKTAELQIVKKDSE